jgi:predicted phosphodiesterase
MMQGFFAQSLVLTSLLLFFAPASASDSYQWVQFTSDGLEARAITKAADCPNAAIDGRNAAMSIRVRPDDDFPILVCALRLPRGAREATINGRPLRLPAPIANKILLVGDTGCRIHALIAQDCNSADAWPFRLGAAAAAAQAPDLVIHLGDLLYRETSCPILRKGCAGSPYGDKWPAWEADFFAPAERLLNAAPWVFVRGNHESCRRAQKGWRRLVDAFPYGAGECQPAAAPFAVDLGGLTLLVLDVTEADDRIANLQEAEFYKPQLAGAASIQGPVWFAFHKPIFTSIRRSGAATEGDNKTLVEAARGFIPANVQAILSGHLHIFQLASYEQDYPAQIVVGNSGNLDRSAPKNFDGLVINGVTVEIGRSAPAVFGFAVMERGADEWLITSYDAQGSPLLRCRLRGRKLKCE